MWSGFNCYIYGPKEGFCEHANERLDFIKGGESFNQLSTYNVSTNFLKHWISYLFS